MSKSIYKAVVIVILVGAVGAIVVMKNPCGCLSPAEPYSESARSSTPIPVQTAGQGLPRMVDLGADKCIPCKLMAPILEQLKKDLDGKLRVDFIDVWKNPSEATKYGIKVMPTQIFFAPDGKELFRHEGFYSREDILGKWKELGVDLGASSVPTLERAEPLKAESQVKESIESLGDTIIDPKPLDPVAIPK
jgi:thioredoxin 1